MAVLTPSGSEVCTAAPIATPSTKLWNAVADEHQRAGPAAVLLMPFAVLAVAVVPEDEFLEHEEGQDAGEQHHAGPRGAQIREHLGQDRKQRHAEQRAHRVADEVRARGLPVSSA